MIRWIIGICAWLCLSQTAWAETKVGNEHETAQSASAPSLPAQVSILGKVEVVSGDSPNPAILEISRSAILSYVRNGRRRMQPSGARLQAFGHWS